jgi:steroid delta-isomerase
MPPDPSPYIDWLENLTRDSVGDLPRFTADRVRFVDPFQDVTGQERMRAVFAAIFDHCRQPVYRITDRAAGAEGWYLRFTFSADSRLGPLYFEGVSEIRYDAAGKIILHWDHWDAADGFYARLPLLGGAIRWLKRRVAGG